MIRSAVTLSLVPEARGGPFVYWDDLPAACRKARLLGYDAIEIFPPGPEALDVKALHVLLSETNLKVAALGTGAGWVKHKLHLCLPEASQRQQARDFIRSMIDLAGEFSAPAIIGSMQGRFGDLPREVALGHFAEALEDLGEHAKQFGVPLMYEPLNRYETDLANTLDAGVCILKTLSTKNIKLLADLFHLNIEETDIPAALLAAGPHVGHVHFVDSNRRPAGCGHIDFKPIVAALQTIGYTGYVSAEAFPWPDSDQAAALTMAAYRKYFSRA
jgi:sugar phosphate isomerase/epimerase